MGRGWMQCIMRDYEIIQSYLLATKTTGINDGLSGCYCMYRKLILKLMK